MSCELGANAPDWLCISIGRYNPLTASEEPDIDWDLIEAQEAEQARKDEAREVRELAAWSARVDAARAREAETRRIRAERSQRHQAAHRAKQAKAPVPRDEWLRRIREGQAKARAEGRLPPLREKPAQTRKAGRQATPRPVVEPRAMKHAPEGMVSIPAAEAILGISSKALYPVIKRGRLQVVKVGRYSFVWLDEVRAYRAEIGKDMRARMEKARQAKAAKPWAKLCRKRGAA